MSCAHGKPHLLPLVVSYWFSSPQNNKPGVLFHDLNTQVQCHLKSPGVGAAWPPALFSHRSHQPDLSVWLRYSKAPQMLLNTTVLFIESNPLCPVSFQIDWIHDQKKKISEYLTGFSFYCNESRQLKTSISIRRNSVLNISIHWYHAWDILFRSRVELSYSFAKSFNSRLLLCCLFS